MLTPNVALKWRVALVRRSSPHGLPPTSSMECVADNLVMSSLTCATTAPADLQHLRVLLVDMLKHVLPLVPTQFQRRKAGNDTLGEVIFMRIKGI